MTSELQKKINRGIKLIQAASKKAKEMGQPLEVCYSGGKDSDAILELTRMAGVEYRAIYKNTTIDPPGTINHVRERGAEIIRPKKTFVELMRETGLPSRFYRFCCSTLKEYHVMDYVVIGVRRDESTKRAKLYTEPERCRVYSKNVKERQYFPLLDWTTQDVADFLIWRGVKCAPVYYDEQGNFHPERRLGCMCCPLMSVKSRIAQFQKYPKMLRLYVKASRVYRETHPNVKTVEYFKDEYETVFCNIFCGQSLKRFNEKVKENMFSDKLDCKQFLENYFKISL